MPNDDFERELLRTFSEECDENEVGLWALVVQCDEMVPRRTEDEVKQCVLRVVSAALSSGSIVAGFYRFEPYSSAEMALSKIRACEQGRDAEFVTGIYLRWPSTGEATDLRRHLPERPGHTVELAELIRAVRTTGGGVDAADVVENDLRAGTLQAGPVVFRPWDCGIEEALRRIDDEWTALGRRPDQGEIAYFTSARRAKLIEDAARR